MPSAVDAERPPPAVASGDSPEVAEHHRPHLDGLRTLAVYLVVAFHAGVDRLEGGFIGVDVFFVLSGYLVTQLLLRDVEGHGGVRFGRFYSRRMRRLLPAAAINLVVGSIIFAAIAPPATVRSAVASVQGAAVYVSNWVFIAQSADYFGPDVDQSPVAHYWSLSVEEQFYLLWPLALAGLVALARRAGPRRDLVLRGAVALGALASVTAALVIARRDLDRAYFGTDTRAYQLLLGALLAMSPGLVAVLRRRLGRVVSPASLLCCAALVVVATRSVEVNPVVRGVIAAVVTVGLLASLEAAEGGWARGVLSWAPITYLGRISYGTYLWHWIVTLVLLDAYDPSGPITFLLVAGIATGLAALSHELVEMPIRTVPVLDRQRLAVIGAGLVVSVLIAVVVAPVVLDPDAGSGDVVASSGVREGTPIEVDWAAASADVVDLGDCVPSSPEVCPLAEGDGARVLLVGESHAVMLAPVLTDVAERLDLELAAHYLSFCPWTLGVQYSGVSPDCLADQRAAFEEVIPAYDPDVVVLAHRPVDDPQNGLPVSEGSGPVPAGEAVSVTAAAVERAVASLRADGRKVVMIEPVPASTVEADPVVCLSEAEFLEECRFVASDGPLPEEEAMRAAAEADDEVWSLDLDPLVCPYLPICDPVVGGLVVHRDSHHLTVGFGRSLADPIERLLVDQGVVERPSG